VRNPGRFTSVTPLLGPAAIPAYFGQHSEPIRTLLRSKSDTDPNHSGHHSDGALKLSGIPPEHCPNCIGTVSGFSRNTVRFQLGTVFENRRSTHLYGNNSRKDLTFVLSLETPASVSG